MTASSAPAPRLPAPVSAWMASHSSAERRIAAALAIVAVIALLWVVFWQPMARDVAALRLAQAGNAAALAQALVIAREMASTPPGPPQAISTEARSLLDRVLAQQNLRGAVTSLDWREGRARIVLAAVAYETLIGTLEALQRDGHLRVVEATITARVEPGLVRAELTLAR
jgi:type II secretory pathway component PulM